MRPAKEQRRHLRIRVTLPVEIVDRDGNVLGTSETLDLSRRGLLIRRPENPPLAVGDEPYVTIDLPTEHSRWEEEDTVEHYCFHARVTRITAESVALHLKQDQFVFILAPEAGGQVEKQL
jgi:hypothetical protein